MLLVPFSRKPSYLSYFSRFNYLLLVLLLVVPVTMGKALLTPPFTYPTTQRTKNVN